MYRVDPTGLAKQQMRELVAQAAKQRRRQILRALNTIVSQLKTRPLEWGDPERRTRKKGGWVYHGVEPPLLVQYAVFEPRKVVWLLSVRALPNPEPPS